MNEHQEGDTFGPVDAAVESLEARVLEEEEEEEEDECRVCRGPAEEGRPLYQPCKCSGSMGMTHQDCLTSWLEVTRGDGRCEICKTKFRFDPQYAENAPDRLPAHEVILGLSSRFLARWLPLGFRILVAASLWLIAAPLLTNCLYHGWMIKPSSILTRWKRELILPDVVSGAVTAAIIIISFLSLMSFADFLRVHWQQPPREQQREGDQHQRRNDRAAANVDDNNNTDAVVVPDDAIDNTIEEFLHAYQQPVTEQTQIIHEEVNDNKNKEGVVHGHNDQLDQLSIAQQYADRARELRKLRLKREARMQDTNTDMDENASADGVLNATVLVDDQPAGPQAQGLGIVVEDVDDDDGDELEALLDVDDEMEDGWVDEDDDDDDEMPGMEHPLERQERNQGARAFEAMDPVLQDDQVDMEINVALDELLGLRGPLSALVRNLLWLLAFNATYLGIFGFVPKTVGSVVFSGVFNTTFCINALKVIPHLHSQDENQTTLASLLSTVEEESINQNTTFKLSDFATVTLGYLSIAAMIVLSRYALVVFQKVGQKLGRTTTSRTQLNQDPPPLLRRANIGEEANDVEDQDAMDGVGIGTSLSVALDTTVSIVKVGVLLFLKMFFLPLFLGFFLDFSTVEFFGHSMSRRLAFAGSDLFSFILLHWVSGITFMLLVTVFLLQLREVAHPDVLARLIRPQEPQPDLLGNLMHETVPTHIKRMLLSLAIYAPLLMLHVTLPVKVFMATGLGSIFPFFHLNFYHILMPQLQIPLELITFHLSMLALLERYKNSIGGLQHRWMKFMCRKMGLTEYLLPRSIEGFELLGRKPVFLPRELNAPLEVDPFFSELATKDEGVDVFVLSNIEKCTTDPNKVVLQGETKANGERVLSIGTSHISLPSVKFDQNTEGNGSNRFLLPTKIGRYRLRLQDEPSPVSAAEPIIEIFREVQGEEIPRPPEGWDDLGAGGAFVQGRWAWAKEKKSVIEGGVAHRTTFRPSPKQCRPLRLTLKVVALMMLSWIAITVTAVVVFSLPLAIGRSFYYLLRVPEKYIHDPLAFCVGAGLFFPTVSLLTRSINHANASLLSRTRLWLSRCRLPPSRKLFVVLQSFLLWGFVAPMALGLSYEFSVVKSQNWFAREEPFLEWKSFAFSWVMGAVVLNTWSFLLYFNCFTKQFWANLGNGILEPPLDENGNANAMARNRDAFANGGNAGADGNQLAWQGNQGRAAKFFKVWRTLLVNWEWDAVDRTILIDDFAGPVTKQIASALVGSSLSFQLIMYIVIAILKVQQGGITLPLVGLIKYGTLRKNLFRCCMAFHVLIQLSSGCRTSLDRWFEAAHEAARDDRYLIGEVLLNYNPEADYAK